MSATSNHESHRTGSLYGALAYAAVVLTCYGAMWVSGPQRYFASEWVVLLVFVLGAVYVTLGILAGHAVNCHGGMGFGVYYAVQCTLLTAVVCLGPNRGYVGILVLPAISQAIFDLRPRLAALVGLYLFGINLVVWSIPRGWDGLIDALLNYLAAFAFTIVFTIITKQALGARRREQQLREEVEAANQQLRDQAAQMEELATTRERNRVAREIHDGVGHYLTVVKTQLDAALALMPTQPDRAIENVTKAAKLAGDALDDVRRSVGTLRTDTARPPLPEALRALTEETGMAVTVRVEGAPRALPPGIEHALFRSVQEGLTNIRKHAAASRAEVALDFRTAGRVALAVSDNGRGASGDHGGFGLRGIRERIEVLGGRVESGNRTGGGFQLSIEVPA